MDIYIYIPIGMILASRYIVFTVSLSKHNRYAKQNNIDCSFIREILSREIEYNLKITSGKYLITLICILYLYTKEIE